MYLEADSVSLGSAPFKKCFSKIYNCLLKSSSRDAEQHLAGRLRQKGLSASSAFANLRKLPSSVPEAHRMFLFKVLLNGLSTSGRMRCLSWVVFQGCPFCNQYEGDCMTHFTNCDVLRQVYFSIYGGPTNMYVSADALYLQLDMDSVTLTRLVAFWYAVYRLRCILARGFSHYNFGDMVSHFKKLINDPWLVACGPNLTKKERRKERICAPLVRNDYVTFRSDGASRHGADSGYVAACGVVRCLGNVVLGKLAVFLGDATNNTAEYTGILHALRYAASHPCQRLCFQVDSLLVARQLQGCWACRSPDLIPLYEEALHLLTTLRSDPLVEDVIVEHIYREFNVEADALANIGIDCYDSRIHIGGVVINEHWHSP